MLRFFQVLLRRFPLKPRPPRVFIGGLEFQPFPTPRFLNLFRFLQPFIRLAQFLELYFLILKALSFITRLAKPKTELVQKESLPAPAQKESPPLNVSSEREQAFIGIHVHSLPDSSEPTPQRLRRKLRRASS